MDYGHANFFLNTGVGNFLLGHLAAARDDLQKALTLSMESGDSGLTKLITNSLKKLDTEQKNAEFKDVITVSQIQDTAVASNIPKVNSAIAEKIYYRWYQTNNKVGIEIKFSLANKDHLKSHFEPKRAEISFPIEAGRDYNLNLELFEEILPESST